MSSSTVITCLETVQSSTGKKSQKRRKCSHSGSESDKKLKNVEKKPEKESNSLRNQHKNWMFTINNPTTGDDPIPLDLIKACVWQKEMGKDKTPHLQGYIELKQRLRMANVKSKISFLSRSHLELRRGSRQQARDYCTKEDSRIEGPWAFGDISLTEPVKDGDQGRRSDLEEVAKRIRSGIRVENLPEEFDSKIIRYSKGLKFLETMISKSGVPSWRKLQVIVMWGPTGTGKTRKAIELAGLDYYMLIKSNGKQLWFDGYMGQKTLIMDEFRSSWCPFEVLLRILDGHPYCPEQKGGHVCAAWTTVYITSNVDPNTWYSDAKIPDQSPLFRRITDIYYVNEPLYADIKVMDARTQPIKFFPIFKKALELPPIVPNGSVFDAKNLISDSDAIACLDDAERKQSKGKEAYVESQDVTDDDMASLDDSQDSCVCLGHDDTYYKQCKRIKDSDGKSVHDGFNSCIKAYGEK